MTAQSVCIQQVPQVSDFGERTYFHMDEWFLATHTHIRKHHTYFEGGIHILKKNLHVIFHWMLKNHPLKYIHVKHFNMDLFKKKMKYYIFFVLSP